MSKIEREKGDRLPPDVSGRGVRVAGVIMVAIFRVPWRLDFIIFRITGVIIVLALIPLKALIGKEALTGSEGDKQGLGGIPLVALLLPTSIQGLTKLFSLMKEVRRPLVSKMISRSVIMDTYPCVTLVPTTNALVILLANKILVICTPLTDHGAHKSDKA